MILNFGGPVYSGSSLFQILFRDSKFNSLPFRTELTNPPFRHRFLSRFIWYATNLTHPQNSMLNCGHSLDFRKYSRSRVRTGKHREILNSLPIPNAHRSLFFFFFTSHDQLPYSGFVSGAVRAIHSLVCCRIILHAREAAEVPDGASESISTPGLVFASVATPQRTDPTETIELDTYYNYGATRNDEECLRVRRRTDPEFVEGRSTD